MTACSWLIFALWLALVAYWALAARVMQRSTGGSWVWWREIAVRLAFFALVVLVVRIAVVGTSPQAQPQVFTTSGLLGVIGLLICLLGVALAILARAYLEPTYPALVTRGPYAWIRHPIYAGLLLAIVGSAIGQSILWLLPLVAYGPVFIRSARHEEKLLLAQFPERYPAYLRQTKMLLPFVF